MQGIVLQDPVRMGYLARQDDGRSPERSIGRAPHFDGRIPCHAREHAVPSDAAIAASRSSSPATNLPRRTSKYTIAVVPKGTTHEFWRAVHYGVRQAAEESGNVAVLWKGPFSEGDRDGQINVVQDFITRGVDGICLAPLDSQALLPVVSEAR